MQTLKRTESTAFALNSQDPQLQSLALATRDAIYTLDIESGDLVWTQGLEDHFGHQVTALQPRLDEWEQLLHPDDASRILSSLQSAIESGADRWIEEYRLRKADGSYAFVLDRGAFIRDEGGRAIRMVGSVIDISPQKRIEEELRRSEAGYRSIFESNPMPMWIYDPETLRFLNVNDAAVARYGYTRDEFLTMTILDIRPEDQIDALVEALATGRGEGGSQEALWIHRSKAGETFHVEVTSHDLADGNGTSRLTLACDVTKRKIAEDQLLRAQQDLEQRIHDRTAELRRANVALQREVQERQAAEAELRESEERYRAIVEDQAEMICRYDADGVFTFVNDAHCRYFGNERSSLIGSSFYPFLHEDDVAWIRQLHDDLTHEAPTKTYELQSRVSSEGGWQKWTVRRLDDEDGNLLGYQAVGRDITARKEAEEGLRRNEARLLNSAAVFAELSRLQASSEEDLRAALDSITEAGSRIVDTDRCSVWLYNEDETGIKCASLYDRAQASHSSGGELLVVDFPRYFEHLATRQSILAHDAHSHPATSEFSAPYLKPLGISSMLDIPIIIGGRMAGVLCCEHVGKSRRWETSEQTVAISAASLCSLALESMERAKVTAALELARDEAEIARTEAERANRAKSEFLSRMSHELRTPLNAILGFSQIIERDGLSASQREGIDFIMSGGRHLLNLINDVLDISRVEAGRLSVSLEPVGVSHAVHTSADLMRPLAEQRGIGLWIAPMTDMFVKADVQRLKQVLINLLSNAIKYNRPKGNVELRASQLPGGRVRISISDTGRGMSAEEIERIFVPFERLQATADIEGSGLGLPLSQSLVSMMDGEIHVDSIQGKGTTFHVDLNGSVDARSGTNAVKEESAPTAMLPGSCTLLSIEDNESNQRLIELALRNQPEVRLIRAPDGASGLIQALSDEPSAILLDMHLPDMSGMEVLNRLQRSALTRDIPIIVLTADVDPLQRERAIESGARAFLTKPLDLKMLTQTLKLILTAEEEK